MTMIKNCAFLLLLVACMSGDLLGVIAEENRAGSKLATDESDSSSSVSNEDWTSSDIDFLTSLGNLNGMKHDGVPASEAEIEDGSNDSSNSDEAVKDFLSLMQEYADADPGVNDDGDDDDAQETPSQLDQLMLMKKLLERTGYSGNSIATPNQDESDGAETVATRSNAPSARDIASLFKQRGGDESKWSQWLRDILKHHAMTVEDPGSVSKASSRAAMQSLFRRAPGHFLFKKLGSMLFKKRDSNEVPFLFKRDGSLDFLFKRDGVPYLFKRGNNGMPYLFKRNGIQYLF